MIKVLFVCHGNICRSPTAEFIMKTLVREAGAEDGFYIESAATSSEELGNGVYPPARAKLREHGISCEGKTARRITEEDVENFDLIIGMDDENMYMLRRRFGENSKFRRLMAFAGDENGEVYDPWYSRDFDRSYNDILTGCSALLEQTVIIDLRECESKYEIYAVLRREMEWQDWYGENLDALYDIVTGLPHKGSIFAVIPPKNEALTDYAERVQNILNEGL